MKKGLIVLVIMVASGLVSCKKQESISEGNTQISKEFTSEHTAQNSLDWNGEYKGMLPCADCDGIVTTIILNSDGTFFSKEEYRKEEDLVIKNKGKFIWDDSGFVITLEGEWGDYKRSFKVIENAIIHLDNEGNEITGELSEHYRLDKKE